MTSPTPEDIALNDERTRWGLAVIEALRSGDMQAMSALTNGMEIVEAFLIMAGLFSGAQVRIAELTGVTIDELHAEIRQVIAERAA